MTNKRLEKFRKNLEKVAKSLSKDPSDVSRAEFMNGQDDITHWDLRTGGGYDGMKDLLFPVERDVVSEVLISRNKTFRSKLEKEYGNRVLSSDLFLQGITNILSKSPPRIHKPVKINLKPKKFARTIVAHLSDTHYGCNINKEEVAGINSYNWTIAARRTALFATQIAQYKPQYRKDTNLVLVINGDIIAGMIHDQEWAVDLLTTQFAGALDILSQMVSFLGTQFKSVEVYCNSGNHGRAMHKTSKDRATTMKWDSYESMLYVALREAVKSCKNISVSIPIAPFSIIDVQGHKIFTTHGDTVINVGNPGKSINMEKISNQVNKINAGLAKTLKDEAKVILVGHVHTPTVQLMDNGVYNIINGCLSGLDGFANSIGIFDSHPTQQIFEATKEHPVGDMRFIQVRNADEDSSMDKIIAPFKKLF